MRGGETPLPLGDESRNRASNEPGSVTWPALASLHEDKYSYEMFLQKSTGLLTRKGCAITDLLLGGRKALNLPASPPPVSQTGIMGLTWFFSEVLGSVCCSATESSGCFLTQRTVAVEQSLPRLRASASAKPSSEPGAAEGRAGCEALLQLQLPSPTTRGSRGNRA